MEGCFMFQWGGGGCAPWGGGGGKNLIKQKERKYLVAVSYNLILVGILSILILSFKNRGG